MFWSTAKIAKICSKEQFYYITPEHIKNGWFEIYNFDKIRVTDNTVYKMPESGEFTAVPREVIDNINPQSDFLVKTRISVHGKANNFGEFPLGEIFDDNTWKWSKELSWALLSSSEPCIDMGDDLWILSSSFRVPKFECEDISKLLCKCMNDAVASYNRHLWPDFTFEDSDKHVSARVSIGLSKEMKEIMGSKDVGKVSLPNIEEDSSETEED